MIISSGFPNPLWKVLQERTCSGCMRFLTPKGAFDNVWHNGLRHKIFVLDLPSKMTCWFSDFLKISPIAGIPLDSVLSPLLFLIHVNDLSNPHHRQNSKSQFAGDTVLWVASKNLQFTSKHLGKDLRKLTK